MTGKAEQFGRAFGKAMVGLAQLAHQYDMLPPVVVFLPEWKPLIFSIPSSSQDFPNQKYLSCRGVKFEFGRLERDEAIFLRQR